MGLRHARKLAELAREGAIRLAGVQDLDPERARAVAHELDAPVLSDLAAVCGGADAACVAVPTREHRAIAERLLGAGLDVLLEKPIASTREEARALIDITRRRQRILQIGHVERFSSPLRRVLPLLSRPRFIEAHRIGPYPARGTDVGVVLDLMIHDLDIVARLAGADVERVEAVGIPVLSTTEDIANARVRFTNGCILNITASRVSLEKLRKIRVFQADAYLSIDLGRGKITVVRREGDPRTGESAKIHAENLELDVSDALLEQTRAFVRAVRGREVPQVTGEDGYRALDLALRIQESLPPVEELL